MDDFFSFSKNCWCTSQAKCNVYCPQSAFLICALICMLLCKVLVWIVQQGTADLLFYLNLPFLLLHQDKFIKTLSLMRIAPPKMKDKRKRSLSVLFLSVLIKWLTRVLSSSGAVLLGRLESGFSRLSGFFQISLLFKSLRQMLTTLICFTMSGNELEIRFISFPASDHFKSHWANIQECRNGKLSSLTIYAKNRCKIGE